MERIKLKEAVTMGSFLSVNLFKFISNHLFSQNLSVLAVVNECILEQQSANEVCFGWFHLWLNCTVSNKWLGLQWRSCVEEDWIQFSEPRLDGSQLPITQASGDLEFSSSVPGYALHMCMQKNTNKKKGGVGKREKKEEWEK